MAKGAKLINEGPECQLPSLLLPLLLHPAHICAGEKLVECAEQEHTPAGWAQLWARQDQSGTKGLVGVRSRASWLDARALLAPPYLKSLLGLGVYPFKLKPQKSALFGPYRALQALSTP